MDQGWMAPGISWSHTYKQGLHRDFPPCSQLATLELKAAAVVVSLSFFCKNVFYNFFFFFKRTFCCELAKPVLDTYTELLTICSICQRDFFFFLQDTISALSLHVGTRLPHPGKTWARRNQTAEAHEPSPAPSGYRGG